MSSVDDFSRRGLIGAGLLALASAGKRTLANPGGSRLIFEQADFNQYFSLAGEYYEALNGAYDFLKAMMDAYASGATIRLVQSYSDQSGLLSTAFTYDNALVIHALLARSGSGDLARAEILGNGLLHAQATNFPFNDGRFGQAYFVNAPDKSGAYITPAATPFYFYTSSTGDQAWAGLALAQLYSRTGNRSYLTGALLVANWIVANHFDTVGPGGYSWGTTINQYNQSVPSTNGKSTEHNIDVYALFTMLSVLTHGGSAQNGATWSNLAQHALAFLQAMFNSRGGYFYTGTNADQITPFTTNTAEDVQTWSYLALQSKVYGVSIDWATSHLITIDTPSCPNTALSTLGNFSIEGMTFDTASLAASPQSSDSHAVWLEGTGHTATALISRRSPEVKDLEKAVLFLENMRRAQRNLGGDQTVNHLAIPLGQGLVSATGNLDTGFDYSYYPNLHIGATGWYAMALLGANPYQLGYGAHI